MPEKPITASSIARMAGNIAAGFVDAETLRDADTAYLRDVAKTSVLVAHLIVAEIERAERAKKTE